jgi:peroxiredoxin
VSNNSRRNRATPDQAILTVGAQAPPFTLADVSGSRQSLDDILDRGPVLLALYKASCPTCQLTIPYLDRIAHPSNPSSLSQGSMRVIGISQDDERGTSRFLTSLGLTMTTLLDREEDGYPVSNAFGITHVPSLFLVETDRRISLVSVGFNKHDLEAIGRRAGASMFHTGDNVPEWKAG